MFRSPSPAPSIAPSMLSQAPSAWLDIDPLAQPTSTEVSERRVQGRNSSSSGVHSTRRSASTDPRSRVEPGLGIFNPNYGWSVDAEGEPIGDEDESVAKGSKWSRSSMFSRVFKSNDSGSLMPPSSDAARRGSHARSDSNELLQPKDLLGEGSSSAPSHAIDRSSTPPVRPSTATKSPPSRRKQDKRRRPMSLNLPDKAEATSPPPPPTVNNLAPETRSDLLRKNRKLQQVLGNDYSVHRPTKSEESAATLNNLAASLGKKSGKAFGKTPAGYESLSRPSTAPGTSSDPLTASHILLTQTPDPSRIQRHASVQPISSTAKIPRSTHLGPRSRSFSASSSILSPVPGTPDSFIDFSSDAGELFVATPISAHGKKRHPFASPVPEDSASITGVSVVLEETGGSSSTPKPLDTDLNLPGAMRLRDEAVSPSIVLERRPLSAAADRRFSITPPSTPHTHLGAVQPYPYALRGRSLSVSSISTIETTIIQLDAEGVERKRRRDQLAKLHRYLGSNVPAGAVLGTTVSDDLPAAATTVDDESDSETEAKWWKGKKKASLGGPDMDVQLNPTENEPVMTEQERTLNVRRKQKMEKVFGHNPPQGLYISRPVGDDVENEADTEEPISPTVRMSRPPTSPLRDRMSPIAPTNVNSLEYLRHSHSINSLSYLIDKEDTESLRNLFNEITREDPTSDMEEEIVFAPPEDLDEDEDELIDMGVIKRPFIHPLRDPRRRSAVQPFGGPTWRRPSVIGVSSPLSAISTSPRSPTWATPSSPSAVMQAKRSSASSFASLDLMVEPDAFQQRRKRAAKLTKFFGADYRSLFGEVLETIENGVHDDRQRGSLSEVEARELLKTLEKLRAKQKVILPLGMAIY